MFKVIFALIESIVNSLKSIIDLIVAIPGYVGEVMNYVNMMPPYITAFIAVIISICVVKGIKRLVI